MVSLTMPYRAEGQDRSSFMLNAVADISEEINTRDWIFLELSYDEYIYVHQTYREIQLVVYYERYDHNSPLSYRLLVKDGEDTFKDVDFLEEALDMLR